MYKDHVRRGRRIGFFLQSYYCQNISLLLGHLVARKWAVAQLTEVTNFHFNPRQDILDFDDSLLIQPDQKLIVKYQDVEVVTILYVVEEFVIVHRLHSNYRVTGVETSRIELDECIKEENTVDLF